MSLFYTDNEKSYSIFSPFSGEIESLSEVPDVAISSYMLGDGFSIIPTDGIMLSPVNGTLDHINNTLNSYEITSEFGAKLLIKLGTRAENLLGDGIRVLAVAGDKLNVGTPICRFETEEFISHGVSLCSSVILQNTDDFYSITVFERKGCAAETVAMSFLRLDRQYLPPINRSLPSESDIYSRIEEIFTL